MAQIGSVMRLFMGEFLLIATSVTTIQCQSLKRALHGILGFNHPILPSKSVSQCLVLFTSVHAITGHPNAQGWTLGVIVDSCLFLHPHTHSISKPYLCTALHLLCPIGVPAAQCSYQGSCYSPSTFALGVLHPFSASQSQQSLQQRTSHCGSLLKTLLALRLFPPQDQLCWLVPPAR